MQRSVGTARNRAGFWLFSANHKAVGTLYIALAVLGALAGGVLSLALRLHLAAAPDNAALTGGWKVAVTAHGLLMVFWCVLPALLGGFGNWFVPLMIGAAETAFPRLNAASFWLLALGFLLVMLSLVPGMAAPALLLAAIQLAALSLLLGAVNFITTILNMRAPGLRWARLPLFCWSILITAGLLVLAMPVLVAAVALLAQAGDAGLLFTAAGGGPADFGQLLWFFGHPEVYIMILPGFGLISHVIAIFARRPVMGAKAVGYAMAAIGLIGFIVWARRLFLPAASAGMIGDDAAALVLALPTSIVLACWLATLWRGRITWQTPLLWALGFMALFILGGVSGLGLAVLPPDQTPDAYFLTAHIHYMLSLSAVFAIFAGFYLWIGKMAGQPYPEFWGRLHFWTFFLGVNLTFFPLHVLGLLGAAQMPPGHAVLGGLNAVSALGAVITGLSSLIFFRVLYAVFAGRRRLAPNYWGEGAVTLEWALPSPAPRFTFTATPVIR